MSVKISKPTVRFSVFSLDKKREAELNGNTLKYAVFNNSSFVIRTSLEQTANPSNGLISKVLKETKKGKVFVDDSFYAGKKYTNLFRKSVLWDFGDGTTIQGTSAEHAYTKAGKYTITCTFFDVDKVPYENMYKVDVIVKESIPTILRFAETVDGDVVAKVSKIAKVARIEALRSSQVPNYLNIVPKRAFEINETVETEFQELPERADATLHERYYSFYQNMAESPRFSFEPTAVYQPTYQILYGRYVFDEAS